MGLITRIVLWICLHVYPPTELATEFLWISSVAFLGVRIDSFQQYMKLLDTVN